MMERETYTLVQSGAGRDKGQIFLIWMEDGKYVYLVVGKYRTISHPKKKKKKHVIPVALNQSIKGESESAIPMNDEKIKYIIKCFKKDELSRR
mgnify:FL=1